MIHIKFSRGTLVYQILEKKLIKTSNEIHSKNFTKMLFFALLLVVEYPATLFDV